MADNKNALRSGAFIIASAVVALAVVIIVSGPERFAAKSEYKAVFSIDEDLQGLRAGDQVRIGGVRVGSIREVVVNDQAETPDIEVIIELPKRYTLREGTTMSVGGLIGSAWLNIDSLGKPGAPPLAANGVIQGEPSALTKLNLIAPKIEAVVDDVRTKTLPKIDAAIDEYRMLASDARTKSLPEVEKAATAGREMIERLRNQIQPLMDGYLAVAAEAQKAVKNVGDFVGPADGAANFDFRKALANIKDATGKINEELPEILKKVNSALDAMNERLTQLKGTAEDLRASMANMREVSAQVREILVDNRVRIDRIISSVEGTANNAKAFTAEILRRPSRLIWKDDATTQNNLSVYFSAREFAEGAQELNDAAGSLRDALKDPRIDAEEVRRRLQKLELSFERFNQVENKLYQSVEP
jgi:phospholipid/cholesterol/gamma-HCH transport system substrate-binding protein